MESQHKELDELLVKAIARGQATFAALRHEFLTRPWRLIDQRLQSLRKHGRIAFARNTKNWYLP